MPHRLRSFAAPKPQPIQSREMEFSDAAISELVERFYARVRDDAQLGPVFASRIEDWGPHLQRMKGFWRTVLRGEPGYQPGPGGPPPVVHRGIAELRVDHFSRWLKLFGETASELFSPPAAAALRGRAQRMAGALGRHLPGIDALRQNDEMQ